MNKKILIFLIIVAVLIIAVAALLMLSSRQLNSTELPAPASLGGENNTVENSPEQIVRRLLGPEQLASNPEITISKATDDYIKADIFLNPGGFYLLAARVGGEWRKVAEGNGIPACQDVAQYNFPRDIVSSCLDEQGKLEEL